MEEIKKQLGVHDEKRTIGLTERLAPIRSNFIEQLFVKEASDIPSSLKLPAPPQICGLKHPGVCSEQITHSVQSAVDAVKEAVQTWIPGFGFKVEACFGPLYFVPGEESKPSVDGEFFWLSCVTPYVILCQEGDGPLLDFYAVEKVMVDLFKDGDPNSLTLVWSEDRQDVGPKNLDEATDVYRKGDKRREQIWDKEAATTRTAARTRREPVQISELDSLIKKMKESLTGIPEGDFDKDEDEVAVDELEFGKSMLSRFKRQAGKRRKATRGGRLTKKLKLKKQQQDQPKDSDGVEQQDQQQHLPEFVAPKNARKVELEGRTFFELHPRGVFTGYCLVCQHRHVDTTGKSAATEKSEAAVCCKSVTFGGKRPFSAQEARRRLLA